MLFDCPYDEDIDDYPTRYRVYELPRAVAKQLEGSWENIAQRANRELGSIQIDQVTFDPTKRRAIDASSLHQLLGRTSGRRIRDYRSKVAP